MVDDPTIHWRLATPHGIRVDETANAWHSGHVTDLLELDSGGLIVATQTGGVWSIDTNGNTFPLSDSWDNPDVHCLSDGPDGPRHFFAGCIARDGKTQGVIWETAAGQAIPILAWQPIVNPLPDDAGHVRRIVVIRGLRRIIVACERADSSKAGGGIFWATIPPSSFGPNPSPRPPYEWRRAKVTDEPADGFYDLAIGATRNDVERDHLEDVRRITVVGGGRSGGLFVGGWDTTGELVMAQAKLRDAGGFDAGFLFSAANASSVSSCRVRPIVLYAVSSWPDGRLYLVLRSRDGGRTWTLCGMDTAGTPKRDIRNLAGELGNGWNNCIAASPTNPGMAAFGWQGADPSAPGPFLTLDSGKTWRQITNGLHLHSDIHTVKFSPQVQADDHGLYVGSDGGLARIDLDDFLGLTGQPFRSDYNRLLPTLQCYSTLIRMFYGTFSASARLPGLIGTGLQDNGNVHCLLGPPPTPWIDIDGGDGGWNAFIADGALLHNTMGGPVAATAFNPTAGITATVIVGVGPSPGASGLNGPVGEAVTRPAHSNPAGQRLHAVAGSANQVYGLWVDNVASPRYRWELIATLPPGVVIGALGSFRGGSIFVGTQSTGRMFVVDTAQGSVLELPVVLPKPAPAAQMAGGTVTRIVGFGESEMFATLLGASATIPGAVINTTTTVTANYVLRLDGLNWKPVLGVGLPNDLFFGLEAVAAPGTRVERGLIVSTDDRVYISRDDGQNWQRASLGLPRRPHCADLRFVEDVQGNADIFLSTYGRSVWMVRLRGDHH